MLHTYLACVHPYVHDADESGSGQDLTDASKLSSKMCFKKFNMFKKKGKQDYTKIDIAPNKYGLKIIIPFSY